MQLSVKAHCGRSFSILAAAKSTMQAKYSHKMYVHSGPTLSKSAADTVDVQRADGPKADCNSSYIGLDIHLQEPGSILRQNEVPEGHTRSVLIPDGPSMPFITAIQAVVSHKFSLLRERESGGQIANI